MVFVHYLFPVGVGEETTVPAEQEGIAGLVRFQLIHHIGETGQGNVGRKYGIYLSLWVAKR